MGPLPSARPPAALVVGEILDGKYEITREIGRGAMGVVYEALHLGLGRRVAIKTLLDQMNSNAELGARFEREAQSASAIGHPNIIDVFDLGRTPGGVRYMVMELLAGKPLDAIMRDRTQLPIPLAIHIVQQVLSGLSAAHKNGIVHRDLKPENIFLIDSEERPNFVKIVDFGISKMVGSPSGQPASTARFAGTVAGVVLGTPLYMSPEQAIGQPLDQRTDVYSTGVVLYEMLCGRTPVEGESYPEIMTGILKGNYPPPRSLRADISPALESTIMRALAREVGKRFPTAAAMRAELVGGASEPTPGPTRAESAGLAGSGASREGMGTPRGFPSTTRAESAGLAGSGASREGMGTPRGVPSTSSIALVEPAELPSPAADRLDRFAPPQDDLGSLAIEHPGATATVASDPSLPELDRPRRRPLAQEQGTMAAPLTGRSSSRDRSFSPRSWFLVGGVLVALAAGVGARHACKNGHGASDEDPGPRPGESPKVTLSIEPKDATVKIDHIPITMGELPLDTGTPQAHLVNAAAPRRVTRRFTFTMSPGMHLAVRLGRTLGAPEASDPPPVPAEISATYPDDPRPWSEIDGAFSRLGRYADCLAATGEVAAELRKGSPRGRVLAEKLGLCRPSMESAGAPEPAMPALQAAADAYALALQKGDRADRLAKLTTSFRAEFLAARATWQLQEVARQEKDEGRKPGWYMRRVALMGQSWLRARKASAAVGHGAEPQRAKFDEYLQALRKNAHDEPRAWEHLSGSGDFIQAAEDLAAVAHGQAGRRTTEASPLDACRKLLTAFDALILD
jgi:serine/threonine protein kinase